MKHFIDISMPIHERMVVYPGDPSPTFITARENGITCSTVHLSLHTGTHIDAPLHVFPQGADATSGFISGPACVVQVDTPIITVEQIHTWPLRWHDRVLVHSRLPHCTLDRQAAQALIHHYGIVVLGLSCLSPDRVEDHELPIHKFLLKNGVILIENLVLDDVPPGRYHLYLGWPSFFGREAAWAKAVLTW